MQDVVWIDIFIESEISLPLNFIHNNPFWFKTFYHQSIITIKREVEIIKIKIQKKGLVP